jgi:hypothetical protein
MSLIIIQDQLLLPILQMAISSEKKKYCQIFVLLVMAESRKIKVEIEVEIKVQGKSRI